MTKKTEYVLRFLTILSVFTLLCAITLSGCSASEDEWVRETIRRNYFRFDGDYSCVSDLDGLSIDEMMDRLDAYSAYYSAREYADLLLSNAGQKDGIGINYSSNKSGGIVISYIDGGSPARAAGLREGDVITAISYGGQTLQITDKDSFSNFLSEIKDGDEITLYVSGGEAVTVTNGFYTASYASMYMNDCGYSIEYDNLIMNIVEEEGIPQLPEKTAYVRLSRFYGNASEELHRLFKIFNEKNCASLILDLRGNGGGYVDLMSRIGGLFTSAENTVAVSMRAVYKDGISIQDYCTYYIDDFIPAGTKVYVMANDGTASAAEALIGVLVSYNILDYPDIFLSDYGDRPPKTYGKGIMQSYFTNSATLNVLKLTIAGVYWHNGRTIHDVGLTLADGCTAAAADDEIVNVGYDDELVPVIERILEDRA